MKADYVLIGERIKFWRQQRELTQERLAKMVELSPGFMSLIETGKKRASLKTLLSLCHALNTTLHDLLVGNQINQTNDYNTDFSELTVKLNESEKRLVYEITKSVCKTIYRNRKENRMKWNVVFEDYETGKLKLYNVFDDIGFRLDAEEVMKQKYDKKLRMGEKR